MQSMTGFGTAQKGRFRVDIRSLNSKHTDIHFKMPSGTVSLEMELRQRLKDRFKRGKFDVLIGHAEDAAVAMRVNNNAIEPLIQAIMELKERFGYDKQPSIESMLLFRDVLFCTEEIVEEDDIFDAFEIALSALEEMRLREGANLQKGIVDSLQRLEHLRGEIEALSTDIPKRCREKVINRLERLMEGPSLDETRIYQEIALLAQKSDITEELSRLESHFRQFSSFMCSDVAGRRLDFIVQEMFREVNTISQKSEDLQIINLTIEMRTEIDRLKEQVQNIQ